MFFSFFYCPKVSIFAQFLTLLKTFPFVCSQKPAQSKLQEMQIFQEYWHSLPETNAIFNFCLRKKTQNLRLLSKFGILNNFCNLTPKIPKMTAQSKIKNSSNWLNGKNFVTCGVVKFGFRMACFCYIE